MRRKQLMGILGLLLLVQTFALAQTVPFTATLSSYAGSTGNAYLLVTLRVPVGCVPSASGGLVPVGPRKFLPNLSTGIVTTTIVPTTSITCSSIPDTTGYLIEVYQPATNGQPDKRVYGAIYKIGPGAFDLATAIPVAPAPTFGSLYDYAIRNGNNSFAGIQDFTNATLVGVGAASVPDADATTKGKLQLAGDLGGTAAAPTVPGLASRATVSGTPVAGNCTKWISSTQVGDAGTACGSGVGGAVSSVAGRIGDVVLTKSDVGLGNVDNTTDAAKPVSTLAQTALNLKADAATLPTTKTAAAGQPLLSYDSSTHSFTQGALTAAQVGALPSGTQLAQTKAGVTSNWIRSYDASTGLFTASQPQLSDLSDASTIALKSLLPITKSCTGTDKFSGYDSTTEAFTCTADQTGAGGSGITTLNTQTGTTQTFSKVDDTNMTLTITSATNNHQFALAWAGTLAKARQAATTVYTDQANTFGAFLQSFQGGANFELKDPTDLTKKLNFVLSGLTTANTRNVTVPDANSVFVVPQTCSNQLVRSISATGVVGCSTITSTDTSGTFSPSAHALLSAAHSDTTAAAPTRGDIIAAVGASTTWQRVAHGTTAGSYPKWNGTDVVASTNAAAGTGSCTNQVVTAENADAAPTCSTIGSAMVDTTIVKSGVDVNTSNQVTALHVTAHGIEAALACADTSASGSAQVCNTSPTFTPAANDCIIYTTTTANTGTGLTLNVNSLGAKSVAKWQGTTTLAANDVLANKQVLACYDGTNWELATIGNAPSAGGGSGTVSANSTSNTHALTVYHAAGGSTQVDADTGCSTDGAGTLSCPSFSVSGNATADFWTAQADPAVTVVASLSTATSGLNKIVTDGSTATDCTAGGGSNKNWCQGNGSIWVFKGTATGAAWFSSTASPNGWRYFNGTAIKDSVSSEYTGALAGTVAIATGVTGLGSGIASFLATPSSANLAAALTDETGTGAAVFATNPALVGPQIGTTTVASLPTASTNTNRVFVVTDSTSATACTTGGGSNRVLCQSNATSWVPLGDGTAHFPDVKIIPAAACSNTTAGAGWNIPASGVTAACRAGTNNLGGALQMTPSAGTGIAQFEFELAGDWDTGTKPYIAIYYGSGSNTTGTVIWTVSTACTKQDGSVTDDPSFIAESAMGTQTMAAASRMWAQSAQLAGAMTNCIAGSTMIVKVAATGTASSAINVYKAVITTPRLLAVQAN